MEGHYYRRFFACQRLWGLAYRAGKSDTPAFGSKFQLSGNGCQAVTDFRRHVCVEGVMVRFVWESGECEQAAVTS